MRINVIPWVGFWWFRKDQLSKLFDGSPTSPQLVIDIAEALAPVVKRHWPQLNDEGLLDNAISTLKESLE